MWYSLRFTVVILDDYTVCSVLSSLNLKFFNVLLLSSIPNARTVDAEEWIKESRLTSFPEIASSIVIIKGRLVAYMASRSYQLGHLLAFLLSVSNPLS